MIGGLTAATIATLIILPTVFAIVQRDDTQKNASLLPSDQSNEPAQT